MDKRYGVMRTSGAVRGFSGARKVVELAAGHACMSEQTHRRFATLKAAVRAVIEASKQAETLYTRAFLWHGSPTGEMSGYFRHMLILLSIGCSSLSERQGNRIPTLTASWIPHRPVPFSRLVSSHLVHRL